MDIGATINQYRILDRIGEGGMGIVYLAEDTRLRRNVALKFVSNLSPDSTEEIARFQREAQAAARLNHPNICTVHELGETDDQTYIAMEHVEGVTLKDRLREGGIAEHDIREWLKQIAEGLHTAHEAGVVHRDIKPANIMITPKGLIKIMDFGIAKFVESELELTQENSTIGTIAYMSPEQARGEEIDQRTDIWSVGVILYEMLTGKRPFAGAFREAVLYAMMHEDFVSPSSINPDTPNDLEAIVERCLQRNRDERYASLDSLLIDLKGLLQSEVPVQSRTWYKNRSVRYAGLATLALMSLVSMLLFWVQRPEMPDGAPATAVETVSMSEVPSLAVLPLRNFAQDDSADFFVDGMTHELITTLAKLDGMRTRSHRSVMGYKETEAALPEIAAALAVDYIVDGTVLIADGNVRITANLIEGTTDETIWGESFMRERRDVIGLQQEVARAIVQAIELKLTPEDETRWGAARVVNPDALDSFYKGILLQDSGQFDNALRYYKQAIAIDSTFARAYAAMTVPLLEGVSRERALGAARKALELDEKLPEAHIAMGVVLTRYREWEEAENHIKTGIALDPNNATAYYEYYWFLRRKGQFEGALENAQRARALDPLSVLIRHGYAHSLYYNRLYDEVIDFGSGHVIPSLLAKGDYADAIDYMGKHREPIFLSHRLAFEGYAYAKEGRSQEAMKVLEDMVTRWEENSGSALTAIGIAIIHIGLDNQTEALNWIEKAPAFIAENNTLIDEDFEVLPSMSQFFFDDLRDHPRFQKALNDLKESLGLE